ARIELEERACRDDREIAVAACELQERIAVPQPPWLERHRGQDLVRLERARHESRGEGVESQDPLAAYAFGFERATIKRRQIDELGCGIEMAERAADRAAIARLAVTDMGERLLDHRAESRHLGGELDFALARHCAEAQRAIGDSDPGE